jgi:hypothetical protein
MDKREAGKRKAEELVAKVMSRMNGSGAVDSLLWWPEILPETSGAGTPGDTTIPLRVFRGTSWKSIGFAGSDIDASGERPEVLQKYESEIVQCLTEL